MLIMKKINGTGVINADGGDSPVNCSGGEGSGGRIRLNYLEWEDPTSHDDKFIGGNDLVEDASHRYLGEEDESFPKIMANPGKRNFEPTNVGVNSSLYKSNGGSK